MLSHSLARSRHLLPRTRGAARGIKATHVVVRPSHATIRQPLSQAITRGLSTSAGGNVGGPGVAIASRLPRRRARPGNSILTSNPSRHLDVANGRFSHATMRSLSTVPLTGWEQHGGGNDEGGGNKERHRESHQGDAGDDWSWAWEVSRLALLLTLVCACTTSPFNSAHSEKRPHEPSARVSIGKGTDHAQSSITTTDSAAQAGTVTDDTQQVQDEVESYGSLKEFRARFKPLKVWKDYKLTYVLLVVLLREKKGWCTCACCLSTVRATDIRVFRRQIVCHYRTWHSRD
jgi:hypothetical protein